MKFNFKHPIINRIRKPNSSIYNVLRLNSAEYGHSYKLSKKKKDSDHYGYYPDISTLIHDLRRYLKVSDKNFLVGLGAESIIKDVLFFFSKQKKRIGFLTPNYFMYNIYSKLYGYKIFNLKINPELPQNLNTSDLKKFISKNLIDIFLLVNPSHPFEKNWSSNEIKDLLNFCKKKNKILIIDEVYQGLGSVSSKKFIEKFDNLIIIGSLSKNIGLPALRVGYMMASKKLIKYMESFRLAIELPYHSIKLSSEYLKNKKLIMKIKKNIVDARKFAHREFKKRGIPAFGYFGNSVTFKVKNNFSAKKIGNFLKKRKIIINYSYQKPFENFLNITTANINNLKIFFSKLDQIKNI